MTGREEKGGHVKLHGERLGGERLVMRVLIYTTQTPPRNSCAFCFPKTHYLSFRASPLFCQIPIGTIGILCSVVSKAIYIIQFELNSSLCEHTMQLWHALISYIFHLKTAFLHNTYVFLCAENQYPYSKLCKQASFSLLWLSCHNTMIWFIHSHTWCTLILENVCLP